MMNLSSSEKRSEVLPLDDWDADLIFAECKSGKFGGIAWNFLVDHTVIEPSTSRADNGLPSEPNE